MDKLKGRLRLRSSWGLQFEISQMKAAKNFRGDGVFRMWRLADPCDRQRLFRRRTILAHEIDVVSLAVMEKINGTGTGVRTGVRCQYDISFNDI